MNHPSYKPALFFLSLFTLTFLGVLLVGRGILFGEEGVLETVPWIWLFGFAVLFFNVVYLFVISIFSVVLKKRSLPETYIREFPKTALCYFVRHEDIELLYQRIDWSLEGNRLPNLDLWILSDSDLNHEAEEQRLLGRLVLKYGARVHYRRRKIAHERKQGNIRDFIQSHPEYVFLYICDADSSVPKGTILTLLKKVLHPVNHDVAIFQTFIRIRNAKTYYARFERAASETSQKLYFTTLQTIFGGTISFGHQCLARRSVLEKIRLPNGILSHDNWDTAKLSQMGQRVAFVSDVVTFDEAPANYIEARKREARWSQGTLQGWPLIFMKGLSPGVRFLSFYGIYCYLAQSIFFIWVLVGLMSQSYFQGELLSFRTDALWFGCFINQNVYLVLTFSLLVIFFHRLVVVRDANGLKDFFYELIFSTFIYSGNFFYATLDFLALPFKKLMWCPMKKNPFEKLSLTEAVKTLLAGTLFGLLGIWYLFEGTPYPRLSVLPIFLSLSLGIPIVMFSSKSIAQRRILNEPVYDLK